MDVNEPTDAGKDVSLSALIDAVKQKDHAAFTVLYKRSYPLLLASCQRVLGARHLSEDAVHDALTKVWTHARQFDAARGSGSAWLTTIARHAALDMQRREHADYLDNHADNATLAAMADQDGPMQQMQENERQDAMANSLSRLSSDEQRSLQLAFYQGLSHNELALQMGKPLGTVKSWIRRGMQHLRNDLTITAGQL